MGASPWDHSLVTFMTEMSRQRYSFVVSPTRLHPTISPTGGRRSVGGSVPPGASDPSVGISSLSVSLLKRRSVSNSLCQLKR